MAIKLRIPGRKNAAGRSGFLSRDPILRVGLGVFIFLTLTFVVVFSYLYVKYDRIIAKRFEGPVFANAARIYATPRSIAPGEKIEPKELAAALRHAGYSEKSGESPMGSYHLSGNTLEIQPGPASYHSPEAATVRFREGKVQSIAGNSGSQLEAYELEPEMITSLFDGDQRSKRQVVKYNEIPKVLIDAVLAIAA